ncbi:glycoside hydrolase family 99-like domain-containing protein [Vibrio atypicus]|uniref:glycoside hydrolase family 99-like domain-containing protein n=1 Tax=Vibrio atypicus TaxID=558271 RepID=UPI00135C95D1|nr:glycoside hydrolase family 99-like domain-containing protein [Vibrio atypicus]
MIYDQEKYSLELCELTQTYFDENYYIENYPDVKEAPISPFEHYLNYGWSEGRNPSEDFDSYGYLNEHPDVADAGLNPLYHYVVWGQYEGRSRGINEINATASSECYRSMQRVHIDGGRSPEYAPRIEATVNKSEDAPKVVAFYLPQFHPFTENDEWWGKGFTEWSNVAKTIPQFEGHYQPRLPSDLGYYDLRLPEVMKEQVEMAKLHGIEAFCFHYYWFAGHRLMERPIDLYLDNSDSLDLPFCLCWANENWSRRWDGSENDILIAQEHSEDDNEAVFYDLLRHFKDQRYLTVDGKPFIVIYRPDIIPDIKGLTKLWRELAKKEGLPGLHMVATNSFGFREYSELGFDGLVEFPPHNIVAGQINSKLDFYNEDFQGAVYDYQDVVDFSLERLESQSENKESKAYYPTVMTAWDNSARKPGRGNVFHGASPSKFQKWLSGCYDWSKRVHPKGGQFVFVNAWNEWAEGTYLEPDKKYGYAYLNAVRSTINEKAKKKNELLNLANEISFPKKNDAVVVAHVFYEDLVEEIVLCIKKAREVYGLDVAISLPETFSVPCAKKLIESLEPVQVTICENRGRDVWPFLQTLKNIRNLDYKYGLKIHSKKSTHLSKGNGWRNAIYKGLLCEKALIEVADIFTNSNVGIVSPKSFLYSLSGATLVDNVNNLQKLSQVYNCPINYDIPFIAGTMFWFNFEFAEKLLISDVNRDLFGVEMGAIDGTVAHAFERFIPSLSDNLGFALVSYEIEHLYMPY